MKVYVSGGDKHRAHSLARLLRRDGHEVVSAWHDKTRRPQDETPPVNPIKYEEADVAERKVGVAACEVFVLLAPADCRGRGKYVEFGTAGAAGKRLFVMGESCPATRMFEFDWASDEATLLDVLVAMNVDARRREAADRLKPPAAAAPGDSPPRPGQVKVVASSGIEIEMKPGDVIDFGGEGGLITFHSGRRAEAMRAIMDEDAREMNRTIAFVEQRCGVLPPAARRADEKSAAMPPTAASLRLELDWPGLAALPPGVEKAAIYLVSALDHQNEPHHATWCVELALTALGISLAELRDRLAAGRDHVWKKGIAP